MSTTILIDLKSEKTKNLFKYFCKKNKTSMQKYLAKKVKEYVKINELEHEKKVLNK